MEVRGMQFWQNEGRDLWELQYEKDGENNYYAESSMKALAEIAFSWRKDVL